MKNADPMVKILNGKLVVGWVLIALSVIGFVILEVVLGNSPRTILFTVTYVLTILMLAGAGGCIVHRARKVRAEMQENCC